MANMSLLSIVVLLSSALAYNSYGNELTDPSWSYFPLQENAGKSELFPMPKCGNNFTLEEATIDQMQDAMSKGQLTACQLAQCYLDRIYQTQPYVNSVMQLNPDALSIAAQADTERKAGHVRGPLHGIPYLVKDNIATKDRMETTAGSWALIGSIVPRDAHVIKKLRESGAVLLGKATMSEWADARSTNYSEGYSGRGGQLRSAYNFTLNPGGSSGGSAVAVSVNAIAFAIGTETDGSIVNPAERNAVVGLKPTVGLTSRAGVVPLSLTQDTVGPFARTVRDAAYVLDAIYGPDSRDDATSAQVGKTPAAGYTSQLVGKEALKGAVFGIPYETFWSKADPEQQRILDRIVELIRSAGATVINGTEMPSRNNIVNPSGLWDWDWKTKAGYRNESQYTYIKVDFYNNIKAYLAELNNTNIRSLEDIIAYNEANDGTEGGFPYPRGVPGWYSGQDQFLQSLESKGVMNETYHQAKAYCQYQTRENGVDAALFNQGRPVSALLAPIDVGQVFTISAQAGYPLITIPAGLHSSSGMPFGLALMQTAYGEGELVKWANAIEDLQRSYAWLGVQEDVA